MGRGWARVGQGLGKGWVWAGVGFGQGFGLGFGQGFSFSNLFKGEVGQLHDLAKGYCEICVVTMRPLSAVL